MDRARQRRLERRGWRVGTTQEFLGLTDHEAAYIEVRLALSVTEHRKAATGEHFKSGHFEVAGRQYPVVAPICSSLIRRRAVAGPRGACGRRVRGAVQGAVGTAVFAVFADPAGSTGRFPRGGLWQAPGREMIEGPEP
jgi:hypothetical protein